MEKSELIAQTKIAFDYIQKLYFEVSYLIKELEGLLAEEDEHFIFGRTSGYAVAARSSNGLDTFSVNYWMYKKLAVFFIPSSNTRLEKGQTITTFESNPKILYFRFVLDDKEIRQPTIYFGVLKNFVKKGNSTWTKIEHIMASIEYNENKLVPNDKQEVHYEDASIRFNGILTHIPLFDVNTGQEVATKLVDPALKIFREI